MNSKVKQVLNGILEQFKKGDIPEAIASATFPTANVPCNKWSFLNRTIMFMAGTGDARGFRQWEQTGRRVKKGSKAFYILVPCICKKEEEGEKVEILTGFKSAPVFRYEDTAGEKLDYEMIELPELPLMDRARQWGISVKAIPGNYRYYGYYCSQRSEICLATPEEKTFFHELAHASHEKVTGRLKAGQDPLQEIVAELSAQALCKIAGRQVADTTGNSYRYIEQYAGEINMNPYSACLKVLSETEKVLDLILKCDIKGENQKADKK